MKSYECIDKSTQQAVARRKTVKCQRRWPAAGCCSPSGLAPFVTYVRLNFGLPGIYYPTFVFFIYSFVCLLSLFVLPSPMMCRTCPSPTWWTECPLIPPQYVSLRSLWTNKMSHFAFLAKAPPYTYASLSLGKPSFTLLLLVKFSTRRSAYVINPLSVCCYELTMVESHARAYSSTGIYFYLLCW